MKNKIVKSLELFTEIPVSASLRPGYYRLRGVTNFRGTGTLAKLNLHTENLCHQLPMLLSGNGRFFELIRIDEEVSCLRLSINTDEHTADSLHLESVELEHISRLERYWIYLTVAFATWYRLSQTQRRYYKLYCYSAFFNPKRAFQAVQNYRLKFGSISYRNKSNRLESDPSAEIPLSVPLVAGVYRFCGETNFRGGGTLAKLHLHSDSICQSIPVLLSGNGRFFELIQVDDTVTRAYLNIKADEHSSDTLEFQYVELEPITRLKRYWIYLTAALETWYRLPRSSRYHHNLFWYSAYLNPKRAYQSVQQYRFKFGTISYDEWVEWVDNLSAPETALIKRYSLELVNTGSPRTLLLIDARGNKRWALAATLDSIRLSFLNPFAIKILVDSPSHLVSSLPSKLGGLNIDINDLHQLMEGLNNFSPTEYSLWIPAGCRLSPHALTWFMAVVKNQPSLTCVYSDHDHFDAQGKRRTPHFKPDWSDEMAYSSGYLGATLLVQTSYLKKCLAETHDITSYRLMLFAAASRLSDVAHIPSILWHAPDVFLTSKNVSRECLQAFLLNQGHDALVSMDSESGFLKVQYAIPEPQPIVSIIIPTRDRLDLLIPCVESVLQHTSYESFEVLIMNNQSEEAATHAYFQQVVADERVRVIPFDHPFNYAAINNYAVTKAKGTLLCLLNNDTQVLTPDWLSEMVSVIQLQGVGAVGAQLRYKNGRLQHAGDLVGGSGCANHLHGILEPKDPGYMHRVVLRQDLSAVTAACLLTHKALYKSLGGLEQRHLKVAFNDVDYCLRLREAGYRVIYTPYAKLIHYESESRGSDISRKQRRRTFKEAQYMRKRWSDVMMNDPFYNPNLNYYRCDFSLDPAPVIKKPWD